MWVVRTDGGFLFAGLTPVCVETLHGIPVLVESADQRVRQRLLPDAYRDPESERQWRRHAVPELERLFLSRAQLVRRDLKQLRRLKQTDLWMLPIRDDHCSAWLSALNAARLALYELNDLKPVHMERDGLELATRPQREALSRIHFLAELQSVLLGDVEVDEEPGLDLESLPRGED
jgi:hypothetical protein